MLPPKTHVLAALQRVSQSRRTCDIKLQGLIRHAIDLRECGKYQKALAVDKAIAVHVERLLKEGETVDQAISALHKALLEEMENRAPTEVTVTITVKGGAPKEDGAIIDRMPRNLQKSDKPKFARLARTITAHHGAIANWAAVPLTCLLLLISNGYTSSVAVGHRCVKTLAPAGFARTVSD